MQNKITINLPIATIERINQTTKEQEIFEDVEDFIVHAIIDLLEKYKQDKVH